MTDTQYIKELPFADYLRNEAISSTQVRAAMTSPLHFLAKRKGPSESTEAMQFGTMVHTMVIEPHKFDDEYIVFLHEGDKRKKSENGGCIEAWKAAKAELAETGKLLVDKEQYDRLLCIRESVLRHPIVQKMLAQKHIIEPTFVWHDGLMKAKCKARPDILTESGIMADLKTTRDASPRGFGRSAATFGYDVQADHHGKGALIAANAGLLKEDLPNFPTTLSNVIIAVESEANVWNEEEGRMDHAVVVYEMAPEDVASAGIAGLLAVREALDAPDMTPAEVYGEGIQRLQLPEWRHNK